MALNPREKNIAVILGITLAAYAGYYYVVDPYLEAVQQVKKDQKTATAQVTIAHHLFDNRKGVGEEWAALQKNGLKSNASDAESVALHAITDFAANRNVHIDSHKTEAPTQAGDFQQMRVTVTGSGSLESIWHLLADIETSHFPLQLGDCRLSSKKADGSDDLTVQISVNTLFFSPPQTATRPSNAKPAGAKGESI